MQTFEDFKEDILKYLQQQKEYEQEDIANNENLPEELKVEKGLLVRGAEVIECKDSCYNLRTFEDNSKMRIGDKVRIKVGTKKAFAKIIDFGLNEISLECREKIAVGQRIDIEILECVLLDPLISLLESIEEGKPGASLLKQLANIEEPRERGLGAINIDDVDVVPEYMDESKRIIIGETLQRPSLYCIQGPPGTGKTAVLSVIAQAYASKRKDVLVIANTHQAVNNALNKIAQADEFLTVIKIGEELKSEGLVPSVSVLKTYNSYLKFRKEKKKNNANIVGMTLHAAVVNLGIRNGGFQPSIVLVDEAGQIPMPFASLIGTFGSGSVVFIGDDKQMPPIFHPKLIDNKFSTSIFAYVCKQYPSMRKILNVTYRMNEGITSFVSKAFYESDSANQRIYSEKVTSKRTLSYPLENIKSSDIIIKEILSSSKSLFICDVNDSNEYKDSNWTETRFSFDLFKEVQHQGLPTNEIAIITPYRRQVKSITSYFIDNGWTQDKMPLINTVECLQGQDVEMIVISFCISNLEFLKQQKGFLFDYHRLNVMISRAKTKVVLLMSDIVQKEFRKLYDNVLKDMHEQISYLKR